MAKLNPAGTAVDYTPPSTTETLAGTAGRDGWYVSPMTVTLAAAGNVGAGTTSFTVRVTAALQEQVRANVGVWRGLPAGRHDAQDQHSLKEGQFAARIWLSLYRPQVAVTETS